MDNRVAELYIELRGRVDQLQNDLRNAERAAATGGSRAGDRFAEAFEQRTARLASGLAGIGAAATTGITLPLGAASVAAIKLASDLNEARSAARVVFGDTARQVEAFADTTANSFYLTRREALDAAKSFGSIFKASGLEKDAARMSIALTALAGDIASFDNLAPADALQKLRSGIVGEAEPLRAIGIQISDNAVKARAALAGLTGELNDGQKTAVRYALIMEQARDKIGDAARTSDGFANQQRALQVALSESAAEIGRELLPAATTFVRTLRDAVKSTKTWVDENRGLATGLGVVALALGPTALLARGILSTVTLVLRLRDAWLASAAAANLASGASAAGGAGIAGRVAAGGLAAGGLAAGFGAFAVGVPLAVGGLAVQNAMRPQGTTVVNTGTSTVPFDRAMGNIGQLPDGSRFRRLPSGQFEIYRVVSAGDPLVAAAGGQREQRVRVVSGLELDAMRGSSGARALSAGMSTPVRTGPYGGPAADELGQMLRALGGGGTGAKPAKRSKASSARDEVLPLTEAMLESMAAAIRTPKGANSCAYFASQMVEQMTGQLPKDANTRGALARFGIGSAASLERWAEARGTVVGRGGRPMAGDLVFTLGNGPSGRHVGIFDGRNVIDSSGKPSSASDGSRIRLNRGLAAGARIIRLPGMRGRGDLGEIYDDAQAQLAAMQDAQAAQLSAERDRQVAYRDMWLRIGRDLEMRAAVARLRSGAGWRTAFTAIYEQGKAAELRYTGEQMRRRREGFYDSPDGSGIAPVSGSMLGYGAGMAARGLVDQRTAGDRRRADFLTDLDKRARDAAGGARKAACDFRALAESLGYGATASERFRSGMDAARDVLARTTEVERLERFRSELESVAYSIEQTMTNVTERIFEDGFSKLFTNIVGGFRQVLAQMAREYVMSQIRGLLQRNLSWGIGQILGGLGGGGGGARRAELLNSAAGAMSVMGARAMGGSVAAGAAYLVGERGPEVFTPSMGGHVASSASAGAPIVINITINGDGSGNARVNADEIALAVSNALARAQMRTA
jgi:hypothetical protein